MLDIQPIHRRSTARHAVALECEGVPRAGRDLTTQHVLDLSPDGAFITTDVATSISAKSCSSASAHRTAPGGCMRAPRSCATGESRFVATASGGLGVRFIELAPEVTIAREQSLAAVPPPVPTLTRPMDYASFVRLVDDGVA